ncbi:MAG: hypothetical protein AAF945_12870 [Actinomycetota bacterium]
MTARDPLDRLRSLDRPHPSARSDARRRAVLDEFDRLTDRDSTNRDSTDRWADADRSPGIVVSPRPSASGSVVPGSEVPDREVRRRRLVAVLSVAAAAALVVVIPVVFRSAPTDMSAGDDSSTTPPSATVLPDAEPPDLAQIDEAVEAFCRDDLATVRDSFTRYLDGELGGGVAIDPLVNAVVPPVEELVERLADLAAPELLIADVQRHLEALDSEFRAAVIVDVIADLLDATDHLILSTVGFDPPCEPSTTL